jgi:hypothetical protein
MKLAPNRLAVYLTAGAGLLAAVAVPLADMDGSSVAGVIAGLGAIALVVHKWLGGWQLYEERREMQAELAPEEPAAASAPTPHEP